MESSSWTNAAAHSPSYSSRYQSRRTDKAMWFALLCCMLLLQGCQGGTGRGYFGGVASTTGGRSQHYQTNKRPHNAKDDILMGIRSAMDQIRKPKATTTTIPSVSNIFFPTSVSSSSSSSAAASTSMTSTRFAKVRPEEQKLLKETATAYLIRSKPVHPSKASTTEESELQCLESMMVPCANNNVQQPRGFVFGRRQRKDDDNKACRQKLVDTDDELDCLEHSLTLYSKRSSVLSSSSSQSSDNSNIFKVASVGSRQGISTRRSVTTAATTTTPTTTTAIPTVSSSSSSSSAKATTTSAVVMAAVAATRPLVFWENMICGAISRSVAQTIMHPANTMKTILQSSSQNSLRSLIQPSNFPRLTQGAGANFVLSVPHGAINFAVLELVRNKLQKLIMTVPSLRERSDAIGPGLDFMSSAISTICCSIVSTPQMMICDNIMAGNYRNLPEAVRGLMKARGLMGFYAGWWPGLVGKIPSYALTWTLFQQLKVARYRISKRPASNIENSIMGCIASATTVSIMIPIDTIKTRLVSQTGRYASTAIPYTGIIDCAMRVFREEGMGAFYRGLPPRLISVVPMIGIQFGVYEAMRRFMIKRTALTTTIEVPRNTVGAIDNNEQTKKQLKNSKVTNKNGITTTAIPLPELQYGRQQVLEEALMEVAADENQPFPAPHFLIKVRNGLNGNGNNGNGKPKESKQNPKESKQNKAR